MDILELINKLESMATSAKRMPITGMAMVDAERLLDVIDQLRLAIPRSISEASEVLERREQIINQTMLDARRIRSTAEQDSRALVEESELVRSARKRGEEMVAEAEQKAQRLIQAGEQEARRRRAGADEYARASLEELGEQIAKVLETVQAGQRALAPREVAAAS
jgi:cell division septum initiation protein DivIVA